MSLFRLPGIAAAVLVASGLAVLTPAPAQADVTEPGGFVAVTPTRVLDTRNAIGAPKAAIGAQKTLSFTVTGGAVPTDASAVVLNVTVAQPTRGTGHITVYPAGLASPPGTRSVTFVAGTTIANQVTTRVGTDGKATVFNATSGTVNVIADVSGYYRGGTVTQAGMFTALDAPVSLSTSNVTPKGTADVPVAANKGIPSDAGAAAFSLTTSVASAPGYITAYPQDAAAPPTASNVNLAVGRGIGNAATVKLGNGGIRLFSGANAGSVLVQTDVSGSYKSGTVTKAGGFNPLTPTRIMDTRLSNDEHFGQVQPNQSVTLKVAGTALVPASADAVVLNVTVPTPQGGGYVTAYPADATRPNASSINFVARQSTIPNLVTVKVSAQGEVTFYNGATAPVDLIADLAGWYRKDDFPLPAAKLNLANWKLTLPIDEVNNDTGQATPDTRADEIKRSALQTYQHPTWFHVNDTEDGVVFRANAGGATTTDNTHYARSELRELKPSGGDTSAGNAAWSNTSGTHTMTITQAITHLPDAKPHVVAGQIHNGSKDVAVVRLEKSLTTGKNRLFVRSDATSNGSITLDSDYQLGAKFAVTIQVVDGAITVTYWKSGNTSDSPTATASPTIVAADLANPWFFKAGVYTQSNTTNSGWSGGPDAADAYGEVVIYGLTVTHDPAL